jgi:hypothetical protein
MSGAIMATDEANESDRALTRPLISPREHTAMENPEFQPVGRNDVDSVMKAALQCR